MLFSSNDCSSSNIQIELDRQINLQEFREEQEKEKEGFNGEWLDIKDFNPMETYIYKHLP